LATAGRAALIETYLARREDLLRFFALRLKSPAAAEDLVQEIYLRLARVEADAPIDNPAGYLYRLGSNLMLEQLRGQRRSAARAEAWTETHTVKLGAASLADEPPADDALAARQRLAAVIAVVRELPPRTQEVFRLHKLEGLSHAETAARLGVSKSAVEKHMIAALKRLSIRLAGPPADGDGGDRPPAASSTQPHSRDRRGNG
jgi:RNA polymerase sigma-70 factor (ECF subfamily)